MNIKTICVHIALAALVFVGASCEKQFVESTNEGGDVVVDNKDDNGNKLPTLNVKFNVLGVESAQNGTASLKSKCKRLSFSVFDAGGERLNYRTITQLSSDKDFGKVSLAIPKGKYSFVFVAENGNAAPTISEPNTVTFKKKKLTDTYCYYGELDIKGKASHDITLKHCIAKLRVTLNDVTPQEVDTLSFYYIGGSSTLDPTTGYGKVSSRQTESHAVERLAYRGKSTYELYTFPHADARKLKLRITAKSGEQMLYTRAIDDIAVESDDVTDCSLNFFGENPEVGR